LNDLLAELRKNPEFSAVLEDALKHRPVIPAFVLYDTKDEQEMVVEKIKYHTALRNGFDSLYQYLTGRKPKGDQ
jgi:hypothetical protein